MLIGDAIITDGCRRAAHTLSPADYAAKIDDWYAPARYLWCRLCCHAKSAYYAITPCLLFCSPMLRAIFTTFCHAGCRLRAAALFRALCWLLPPRVAHYLPRALCCLMSLFHKILRHMPLCHFRFHFCWCCWCCCFRFFAAFIYFAADYLLTFHFLLLLIAAFSPCFSPFLSLPLSFFALSFSIISLPLSLWFRCWCRQPLMTLLSDWLMPLPMFSFRFHFRRHYLRRDAFLFDIFFFLPPLISPLYYYCRYAIAFIDAAADAVGATGAVYAFRRFTTFSSPLMLSLWLIFFRRYFLLSSFSLLFMPRLLCYHLFTILIIFFRLISCWLPLFFWWWCCWWCHWFSPLSFSLFSPLHAMLMFSPFSLFIWLLSLIAASMPLIISSFSPPYAFAYFSWLFIFDWLFSFHWLFRRLFFTMLYSIFSADDDAMAMLMPLLRYRFWCWFLFIFISFFADAAAIFFALWWFSIMLYFSILFSLIFVSIRYADSAIFHFDYFQRCCISPFICFIYFRWCAFYFAWCRFFFAMPLIDISLSAIFLSFSLWLISLAFISMPPSSAAFFSMPRLMLFNFADAILLMLATLFSLPLLMLRIDDGCFRQLPFWYFATFDAYFSLPPSDYFFAFFFSYFADD